jgi:CheY-like chemotaxis protein
VSPAPSTRLDGRRVLLVDDDPDTLELLTFALQLAGAQVASAASASAALQALDHGPLPDVVLTDVSMPDDDGYTFLDRLRRRPAERGGALPALALTAGHFDSSRGAGFLSHIQKPIEPAVLIGAVHAATSRPLVSV